MKKKRIRSTKKMDKIVKQIESLPDKFEQGIAYMDLAGFLLRGKMMRYLRKRYNR